MEMGDQHFAPAACWFLLQDEQHKMVRDFVASLKA